MCAVGVLLGIVILAGTRTASLDEPGTGACEVFLSDVPIANAHRPDRAIEVSSAGSLVASGVDPAGTTTAEIRATLSENLPERATWNVRRRSFEPARNDFEVAVTMSEVAGYGVGLTLVTVVTDHCATSGWIEVGDRPPVFTAIGVLGLVLTSAGSLAILVNLWRSGGVGSAGGTRGATFPGALGGGVPFGAGVATIAQQVGATPLSPRSLMAWIVIGSAGAGLLHLTRRSISLWRHARRTSHATPRT